jgi:hypothetical protein
MFYDELNCQGHVNCLLKQRNKEENTDVYFWHRIASVESKVSLFDGRIIVKQLFLF